MAGCSSSRQPSSVRDTTPSPGQRTTPTGQLSGQLPAADAVSPSGQVSTQLPAADTADCQNPENIRSLRRNITNKIFNAFLEAGHLYSPTDDNLHNRSLCGWHYKREKGRAHRYPRQIPEAVCESTCRGMKDTVCLCEPLVIKLLVGVRKQCPYGRQIWVYELEDHQVACVASTPRVVG